MSTSPVPSRRGARLPLTAACLAGAWLLPVLTHALGVDVVLIPAVVIAAASLVRSCRTILDQIMVAVVALFGALCVAGLAFSMLPFGPHPVPLAGTALTALLALAAATGRRPALRWRSRPSDWIMIGYWTVVAGLILRQFLVRDAVGRLALLAPGEDLARHFVLFDAIGELDGYAFLHPHDVERITPWEHAYYPQGWHLTLVVLDRFWRSTTTGLTGQAGMDWFVWGHVATFVFFCFAVLWAARRLAGPLLTGGRAVVIGGAATAYLYFGDPVTIFLRGFPNELAALGFVAIAVALLARPLSSVREQTLTVAALLVAISFTYYLFLPVVGVAAIGWLIVNRRRLRRRPVTFCVALAFAAFAAVPVATNPVANRGEQFLLPGTAIPVEREALAVLLLATLAGLTAPTVGARGARLGRGRGRSCLATGAWRIWAATTCAAVALSAAIIAYQFVKNGGGVPYYGEKAFHLLIVLLTVGLGAVARLLPRFEFEPVAGGDRRPAAPTVLPVAALALVPFAMVGAIGGPPSSSEGGSYGMGLLRGREGVRSDGLAVAYWGTRRYPKGDGRITVDLSHGPWANFYGTLYGISMQRTYVAGVGWYAFMFPGPEPKTLADLERRVLETDEPLRFVVGSRKARFLVVDPARSARRSGSVPETDDVGDPSAMTNIEAARYLELRYPGRVEVVAFDAG